MATTRIRRSPSGAFDDVAIDPGELVPGPLNTAIRTLDKGDGPVADWQPGTGGGGLFLIDYYARAGNNWADALILALTEVAARPLAIVLPAADIELDKRIGDFAGGDGLASGLTFVGFAGATRFVRPQGSVYTSMFAFAVDSDNVCFTGVGFHAVDTAVVGLLAVHVNNPGAFNFVQCELSTGNAPTNQGNGIALGLFGSRQCSFVNGRLDHAQVGFAGLGYGCNGAVFANNKCSNVHDFAVSAVCGPPEVTPLEIRNVTIANNEIDGVNGSGAIFVGSDGGSDPADYVSGISIDGNVITPVVELGHVGLRSMIAFVGGLVTRQVSISNNVIADDTESTQGIFGVNVSTPAAATEFVGLSIANNTIGQLGADGGVQGIYVDAILLDDSQIVNNVVLRNRGIFVANPVNVEIAGNKVRDATASALQIVASQRSITGLRVKDNDLHTAVVFENAIRLTTAGALTAELTIEQNKLEAEAGEVFSYIPNAGSAAVDWIDNTWTTGIGAAALAAIRNKRPAFIPPGNTSWDGAAPLVLTLLPVGHRPGLYLISFNIIIRTANASGGTISRAISFSSPTFGATGYPASPVGPATTVGANGLGQYPANTAAPGNVPFPAVIESSGTAPVTITFTMATASGGPPVFDVYASATLIGIIPP